MTLDCEFNQPSKKIIEIGAAVFDPRTAELIARLEIYVNPEEPLDPEIITLTGITDSDVKRGISIRQAYEELKFFSEKHKCFRNPFIWGAGDSNDSQEIHKQSGVKEDNFMGRRVIDVKTIYQSNAIFHNSQYAIPLADCVKRMGLSFEGRPHRALPDAIATFRVWYHMMKTWPKL